MVAMDGNIEFQPIQPAIQQLVQKVQQAQQAQRQQMAESDPTAQVLMKTQLAETQRKADEAQMKAQMEVQKQQQNFDIKIVELQQKVDELMAKYNTQSQIDSQKNAKDIALANINNAAKERVAMIAAGAELDAQQRQLEHEQNQTAMQATQTAETEILKHGIAIEQQAFQQQAQAVQAELERQATPNPTGATNV
jgi:hypothetical protein